MNPILSSPVGAAAETATLARLRRLLLATFITGAAGTGTELLLIGHFEDRPQIIPLALIVLSLAACAWLGLRSGRTALRAFQAIMAAFVVSGAVGVGLHYQGNEEFELEMYPDLAGFELFRETMTGALPVLAPGTMSVLGLVGLAFSYRHPQSTPDRPEA